MPTLIRPSQINSVLSDAYLPSVLDVMTTEVDLNTSTTQTTIATLELPANSLSANNFVQVIVPFTFLNNTGGNVTILFAALYGGTTICTTVTSGAITTSANVTGGKVELWLKGDGTTGEQEGVLVAELTGGAPTVIIVSDTGTAAEDSTTALNIVIQAKHSSASASMSTKSLGGILLAYPNI